MPTQPPPQAAPPRQPPQDTPPAFPGAPPVPPTGAGALPEGAAGSNLFCIPLFQLNSTF
jgi:hypothetical protein